MYGSESEPYVKGEQSLSTERTVENYMKGQHYITLLKDIGVTTLDHIYRRTDHKYRKNIP